MKQCKRCKHCDVMFLRPDDTPIPDDACTRCYEEVEALKEKDKKKVLTSPFLGRN